METLKNHIGLAFYRLLENIDGERHIHIISYKSAERIKVLILIYLING